MRTTSTPVTSDLLEELRQTACLLAGRSDISVVEGRRRKGWSFNSATGVISMDSTRLRTESTDFNRGLLLHEGAHAAITRLRRLIQGDLYTRPEVFAVINAVEDCRIESWLMSRFPGSKPWIEDYNGKLIRSQFKGGVAEPDAGFPPILALPWVIVSTWWHGVDAVELPPEWRSLRDEIWPFVDVIQGLFPRALAPAHEVRTRYDHLGLAVRFLQDDGHEEPDVWEKEIRLCQSEMWRHFEQGITPVLRRLLPDLDSGRNRTWYRKWLGLWLEDHLGPERGQAGRTVNRSIGMASTSHRRAARAGQETPQPWNPDMTLYEVLRARQARAIERLSEEVLRRLQPEAHRRWTGPHTSGTQLCLRSVVRAEGDPSLREWVWRKQTHLTRPDPLIVLLVDRSSSMKGERMEATAESTVLLSETCVRCGIGLSLFAFSRDCTQIIDWRQSIDTSIQSMLGGLAKAARGGTDLESALREVRPHLAESSFAERYLVVLSDGGVSSADEVRQEIHLIERDGVHVIGLGIGPDTQELRDLIRESQAELTPAQLPGAFMRLLGRTVPPRNPAGA
jgi:Mg-chelatase subunit ChlD